MKVIPVIIKSTAINEIKNSSEILAKKTNKIISRDLPNCIGAVDEMYGVVLVGRSKFYPEDLKKMEGMTIKERLAYKKKLLLEGKVYEE